MMIFLDPNDPDLALLGPLFGVMGLSVTPISVSAPVTPPRPAPQPGAPPPEPLIDFGPVKKRRSRTVLKRFPFVMRAQKCDFKQRDIIAQYLRDFLGEANKDWHNANFDFYFTKREHAMMIVTRFRGTRG